MLERPEWPAPREDAESAPFWQALREGQFLLPQCDSCQQWHFYPRALCPHCRSKQVRFAPAAGRGTVYTYTVNRQPAGAEFAEGVPYIVALVTLDEGPRMLTRIVDCPPEAVTIGAQVVLAPLTVAQGAVLPCFRLFR
jgi:uncharacterized OB-fold protein